MSFWNNLPKPFFAMAPMKDVTDTAFRELVSKCGKPDVFWTEFVSADGLYHTREIQKMKDEENPLMHDLQFSAGEHPIVAQIFSSKPEMISYAARIIAKLGFDGIDLNMGCPDKAIEKQGCGAAMIKNPKLAVEIISAAKEAAFEAYESQLNVIPISSYRTNLVLRESPIPVSVKTRVGYSKESLEEPASPRDDSTRGGWLTALLEANPAAITIHLRTRKELSLAPANWELMKKAVEIRNKINPNVLLIGNGDVQDLEDAKIKAAESGCDGIMIGRGMFGNPWVFEGLQGHRMSSSEIGHPMSKHGLQEKLNALIELAHNFEKLSPPKNFSILKKHIKAFVAGFAGAADLRAKLMKADNADDLEKTIRLYT